jgi:hypothetical protein
MIPDEKAMPLVAKYTSFWNTVIKVKIDALNKKTELNIDPAFFEAQTGIYVNVVNFFPLFLLALAQGVQYEIWTK